MMRTVESFIGLIWVLSLSAIDAQVTTQHDQCIDQAFYQFHQAMTTKFPQYENFTISLPSSRHLFQNMLIQNFTTDSLKEYCKSYVTARKEYERCSDSSYKRAVLSGFGLADYICINRPDDYANGLPCLEHADRPASDNCRSKCTQYERASYSYLHPSESQANTDMTTYMAGDCQYLQCWINCRTPYLVQECGNKTAQLESDSLVAAYSTLHDLYEMDTTATTTVSPAAHFPNECKPFVVAPNQKDVVGTTKDSAGSPIPQTRAQPTLSTPRSTASTFVLEKIFATAAFLLVAWIL